MRSWWAIDVGAHLLSSIRHLTGVPSTGIDVDEVIRWIRSTELPWFPGSSDLYAGPWETLDQLVDDTEVMSFLFGLMKEELAFGSSALPAGPRHDPIFLPARRRLPLTTLEVISGHTLAPPVDTFRPCADGHVHQGAALPLEVIIHWVARRTTTIGGGFGVDGPRFEDVTGQRFNPLPLLLLLRAVVEGKQNWQQGLALAQLAATGSADSWHQLGALMDFDGANESAPNLDEIRSLKGMARSQWVPDRLLALLRLEAVLHGSVTQRAPGLDLFVGLFESMASMRRGRFPKAEYYEMSIGTHVEQSPGLCALELRLGEPVSPGVRAQETLVNEYRFALEGYRRYAGGLDVPPRVTFPLGLVKIDTSEHGSSPYWRYNPSGIYSFVEGLIGLLEDCPSLLPFIDGIDVCGREDLLPNWLFGPPYERLARKLQSWHRTMTFRFHAGEWQWSPLHGLRRIDDFLAFDLPGSCPRRIGHGLALCSDDWSRLAAEPLDELLDDLVWAFDKLSRCATDAGIIRLVDRLVHDLFPFVYSHFPVASPLELAEAYRARSNGSVLRRVGFLDVDAENGSLTFGDYEPQIGRRLVDRLVVERLRSQPTASATLGELIDREQLGNGTVTYEAVRLVLTEAYDLLRLVILDDVRWGSVVVEACPTSNVMTGGVRGYRFHPVGRLIASGALVTINTDDPALFHTWIGEESVFALESTGMPLDGVDRARRLGLRIVAPELGVGSLQEKLDAAIASLG